MRVLVGSYNTLGKNGLHTVITKEKLEELIDGSVNKQGGSLKVELGSPKKEDNELQEDFIKRCSIINIDNVIGNLNNFEVIENDDGSLDVYADYIPNEPIEKDLTFSFGIRGFSETKMEGDRVKHHPKHLTTWDMIDIIDNKPVKPVDENIRDAFIKQWNDNDIKNILITHNACDDGRGTAATVMYYNKLHNIKDTEIVFLDYDNYDINDLIKQCNNAIVYVGDFSFMGEDFCKLESVAKNLIIVDHHETPYKSEISDYPNTHFDMYKSGALLSYEFFFRDSSVGNLFNHDECGAPLAIQYISDRDLYKFKLGFKTKALNMLLKEVPTNSYDLLLNYIQNPDKMEKDIEPYIEKVKSYELKCEERASKSFKFTIAGQVFYGLNLTSAVSDVLNVVSKLHNTPSVGYWIKEDSIQFALRNGSDNTIALDEFASKFGGGGHKNAAGFTLKFHDMDLEEFFINRNIN